MIPVLAPMVHRKEWFVHLTTKSTSWAQDLYAHGSFQSRLMGSYRKDATQQEIMNGEYTASHLPAAIISRFDVTSGLLVPRSHRPVQ
jgi:hypothetical protein